MRENTFDKVEIKEYYIKRVASGMRKYFFDNIFKSIFEVIKSNSVVNSKSALINAIRNHRIYYKDGAFRTDTRFSNDIAKTLENMGAVYKSGSYFIEKNKIPLEITQALSIAANQAIFKLSAIKTILSTLDTSKIDLEPYITVAVQEMYKTLEKDIVKSALKKQVPVIELGLVKPKIDIPKAQYKNVESYWKEQDKKAEELKKEIKKADKKGLDTAELKEKLEELNAETYQNAPDIKLEIDNIELDEQSKKIATDYTYNMKYWVKNWEAKNIIKMREDVLSMVQKGARVPEIEKYFLKRWKIAGDKAYFLAKNESHLASSVIQKTQYEKLGSNRFKWGRSSAKEKRELHKEYYGKTFYFDDPPIIDEKLGIKGLPRQIWNCLCHMEIVVPTLAELQNRRNKIKNEKTLTGKLINATTSIFKSKQCDNYLNRYRRFDQREAF
jgi:hypothetical protein